MDNNKDNEIEVKMAKLEANYTSLSKRVDQLQKELNFTKQAVNDNSVKIVEISERLLRAQYELETRITREFAELKEMIQDSNKKHSENLSDLIGSNKDEIIDMQKDRLKEIKSIRKGIVTAVLGVLATTVVAALIKVIAVTIAGG